MQSVNPIFEIMKHLFNALLILALLAAASCQQKAGDELSLPFEKYQLDNGLNVILHQDKSDPIVSVAIYYHVGSTPRGPRSHRVCTPV